MLNHSKAANPFCLMALYKKWLPTAIAVVFLWFHAPALAETYPINDQAFSDDESAAFFKPNSLDTADFKDTIIRRMFGKLMLRVNEKPLYSEKIETNQLVIRWLRRDVFRPIFQRSRNPIYVRVNYRFPVTGDAQTTPKPALIIANRKEDLGNGYYLSNKYIIGASEFAELLQLFENCPAAMDQANDYKTRRFGSDILFEFRRSNGYSINARRSYQSDCLSDINTWFSSRFFYHKPSTK